MSIEGIYEAAIERAGLQSRICGYVGTYDHLELGVTVDVNETCRGPYCVGGVVKPPRSSVGVQQIHVPIEASEANLHLTIAVGVSQGWRRYHAVADCTEALLACENL